MKLLCAFVAGNLRLLLVVLQGSLELRVVLSGVVGPGPFLVFVLQPPMLSSCASFGLDRSMRWLLLPQLVVLPSRRMLRNRISLCIVSALQCRPLSVPTLS